jgi:hypothetical protein
MWIIDSMGLTPSVYPAYQWYVWGFIGLALKGVKFEGKNKYNVIMRIRYKKICLY